MILRLRLVRNSASTATEHIATHNTANGSNITESGLQSLSKLREISVSSFSRSDVTCDWAPVELSETSVLQAQAAVSKDSLLRYVVLPTRFVSCTPRNDTEIVAIKGCRGISKGGISYSTTMMRLHPRVTFQEAWAVRLDGPLGRCSKPFGNLQVF